MTRIVTLLIFLCSVLTMNAQTEKKTEQNKTSEAKQKATEQRAQELIKEWDAQKKQGEELDKAVDKHLGTSKKTTDATKTTTHQDTAGHTTTYPHPSNTPHTSATKPRTTTQQDDNEMNIPTVDMRKKVMRRSYKVNGYRVQAYSGGNKRTDKVRAQQIGNAIKMAYPDQPVYVHFYSPRWVCRVGNYRSYSEAQRMLKAVKKMGYKSAMIVKGRITVQY